MLGNLKPFPLVQSKPFLQGEPRVSPNSRWLAYTTNKNGPYQIMVQAFPDPNGNTFTVTADGGFAPDGKQFIAIFPPDQASRSQPTSQINVVLNWFEDLKQRVPVK